MSGEMMDWVGVGERLRRIRRECRLSQRDFGRRFGVSQNMISLYEKGRSRASVEFYVQVAKYGDKTIEWLLLGSEDRTAETLREMRDLHERMNSSLSVVRHLLDRESILAQDEKILAIQDSGLVREQLLRDDQLPRCLREILEDSSTWREFALTGREAWALCALVRLFGEMDRALLRNFVLLMRRPPAPAGSGPNGSEHRSA